MQVPNTKIKKRGNVYYLHYFENGIRQRISLQTSKLQIAKDKQRHFESARARGENNVFPTQTLLERAISAYCKHMN